MTWIRGAALRPVSPWAVVPGEVVQELSEELSTAGEDVRSIVDRAYREFDARQPIVSGFVAERVNALGDPTAIALGYFLSITVFMMFERAFSGRIREVTDEELHAAREALDSEDELRQKDAAAWITSEDVVASQQPNVLAFVRQHLDAALEGGADDGGEEEAGEGDPESEEEEVEEEEEEEEVEEQAAEATEEEWNDTMGEPLGVMGSGLDVPSSEESPIGAVSREELGAVYDAVLVEVVALSHAVDPPDQRSTQEDGTQEPQA